jgi:iron complex transport system substrate-binding protein
VRRGRLPAFLILFIAAFPGGCNSRTSEEPRPGDARPAARIVTLAPHLAELVFAVGAGDQVVGVSSYTDYPEKAASLPAVGDAFSVDQERLAMLEPDLLLAWASGTPAHVVDELRARGFRVETVRTRGLDDVAVAIERIGELTGHQREATEVAAEYRQGLHRLAEQYRDAGTISVFYQVSRQPLYTINGEHYVSELIEICGGRNIFSDLGDLAPMVGVEAVLSRNPEVMLASDDSPEDDFDVWRRWPELAANRLGNYFFLPADEIGRPTPRLLDAGKSLCKSLERARASMGGK